MIDFTRVNPFSALTNFIQIKFGANAPLLDKELNEMQSMLNYKRNLAISNILSNGFISTSTMTITDGILSVPACNVVVNGDVLEIKEAMTIAVNEGDVIYLEIEENVVLYTDVIYESGNQSGGSEITNNIVDPLLGAETSRRIQKQFTLTNTISSTPTTTIAIFPVATIGAEDAITDDRTLSALQVTAITVKGSSTFNSTTGRTITHNLGTTAYNVIITPTEDPAGLLGEFYVIISANSFTVYNSGTATTAFKYSVMLD